MWYREQSNQYINDGMQFVIDGMTYPAQWMAQATPEQKAELGLVEVVATNTPYDPRYYWTGEVLDKATLTYTGIPKNLDEVKSTQINQLKQIAYSLLLPSDWMVVRSTETNTPMDENWKNYRQEIRDKVSGYIQSIEAAEDVDTIAEIQYTWPEDPTV